MRVIIQGRARTSPEGKGGAKKGKAVLKLQTSSNHKHPGEWRKERGRKGKPGCTETVILNIMQAPRSSMTLMRKIEGESNTSSCTLRFTSFSGNKKWFRWTSAAKSEVCDQAEYGREEMR
jgi:hypothetical protein